ncbi:MAG: hypothetical protein JJU36_16815 [Phycisphaeraceae bacterium]|nr:hypothetical protein [Phycisphaeraceae bacterium]
MPSTPDTSETPDISPWPLLLLMERLDAWRDSARGEDFWRDTVEHRSWADQLRDEAKGIIVWLELKGQDDAAARLDEAMGNFRQAIWNFQEACEGVYPADDPRCRDARDAMIEAAGRASGAAEDLDSELPADVWEGFFDA